MTSSTTSDSSNSNSNISQNNILEGEELKQTLYDVLNSDDYSNKIEVKVVKPKEELDSTPDLSWLEDLLKWLFDNDIDGSFLPALIKGFMIVALLLLIYWIIKNSDSLISWVKQRQWKVNKHRVKVEDYRQSHLAQGWESLPPHNQIPNIVQQLLVDGDIMPAGSILYRGSLRWLNDSKLVNIKPANTELQCIELINHIERSRTLPTHTQDYISNIINQWIPIAYDSDASNQNHQQTLSALTNHWHEQLQSIQQHPSKQLSKPNQSQKNSIKEAQ